MLDTDRTEFDASMDHVWAGYGMSCTPIRRDAYWQSLRKMSLIDFQRIVEHCLSEQAPEKVPTHQGMWLIARRLKPERALGALAADRAWEPWLLKGNNLLLRYIRKHVCLRPKRYGTSGAHIDQSMRDRVQQLVEAKNSWVRTMQTDESARASAKQQSTWETLMRIAEGRIDDFVAEEAGLL